MPAFLFAQSIRTASDSTKSTFITGIRGHYGYIIYPKLAESSPWGVELEIGKHFATEKAWQSCLCYPRMGLLFNYFYFDNKEILGSGWSAMGYVEPFFRSHKKLSFSIKGAAGFVYLTNPYDSITNPDNIAYSTSLSGIILLNFGLNYRLKPNLNINIAAGYNHSSNGGLKQPNKGINFPTVSAGANYIFNPVEFIPRKKTRMKEQGKPKKRLDITVFGTSRAISIEESKRYMIYGSEVKFSKQIGRISALTIGAEWLIDGLLKEQINRGNKERVDHQNGSAAIGHEFLIGKFLWSQQFGLYIYKPYDSGEVVYHRHGLMFRITPRFQAGINLKVHRHIAQYTDLRIGLSL